MILRFFVICALVPLFCFVTGENSNLRSGLQQQQQDNTRRHLQTLDSVSANIKVIREEIREVVRSNRPLAAKFIRLGFHDCIGGCDGCVDLTDPDNNGLDIPINSLNSIVSKWKDDVISRADIWALATLVGAEMTQSQEKFHLDFVGRVDCENTGKSCLDANGNSRECKQDLGDFQQMPRPDFVTHETLEFFATNFGFNAKESVAIMGAHSVGTASVANSGFEGPKGWDNTNYFLDNDYYRMLVGGDPFASNPLKLEDLIEAAPGWTQQTITAGTPDRIQWFRRRSLDSERIISLHLDVGLVRDLEGLLDSTTGEASCSFKNAANMSRCPHAASTINLMAEYRYNEKAFLKDFEAVLKKMTINGYTKSQLTLLVPEPVSSTTLPEIAVSRDNYMSGETIEVSFTNPSGSRIWIAVRRHDVNPNDSTGSGNAEDWAYPCGTKSCSQQSLTSGSFSFDNISDGRWRVYMMTDMTSPYEAVAFSSAFIVGEAGISTSQMKYETGSTVNVQFSNPLGSRVWLAVWSANANPNDPQSGSSAAWAWPCGSQTCNGDTLTSGSVSFSGIGDGLWRAFLMLDMVTPYESIASTTFAIGNVDNIFANKKRYNINEKVQVSFDNLLGLRVWIGVFPADSDPQRLMSPSTTWSWPCGTKSCTDQSLTTGSIELTVPEGEWRAYMMSDMYSPYASIASTDAFIIAPTTARPTITPTEHPTHSTSPPTSQNPTSAPSFFESDSPSSNPTIPYFCPIESVIGRTFFFTAVNQCWRLNLFENGTLEADSSDPTCSNDTFNSSGVFSVFESIDSEQNLAIFGVGPKGYSGTVEIKETQNIEKTNLKLINWKEETKEFVVHVVVPSCESEPSLTSISPSPQPSMSCSKLQARIAELEARIQQMEENGCTSV